MELKIQLKELRNTQLECLRNKDLNPLIEEMLNNIGSPDHELRDELIYTTFIRIINEGVLTGKQYQYLFEKCIDDNHLFYKIGEKSTDSVFTRAFSSLVITGLLSKDREVGVLPDLDFKYVLKRTIEYLRCEQDTRGYVDGKGWAHSIAHGADLLTALVRHNEFTMEYSTDVLNAVQDCLFKEATYIDDEEERLIFVLEAFIERNLDEKKLERWLLQIINDLELIYSKEGFSNKYFRTKFNLANFLKALYFRIEWIDEKSSIRILIKDNLKELHRKVYRE